MSSNGVVFRQVSCLQILFHCIIFFPNNLLKLTNTVAKQRNYTLTTEESNYWSSFSPEIYQF